MENEEVMNEQSNEVQIEPKSTEDNGLSELRTELESLKSQNQDLINELNQVKKDLNDAHAVFMGTGRESIEKKDTYQSKIGDII